MHYRALAFLLVVGCGDGGTDSDTDTTLAYYAHPCGNGDPVTFECATGLTEVPLADADWPLCTDDGIAALDTCAVDGDKCVLEPAVACSDEPTVQIRSASYLFCQSDPFAEDEPCPQSSRDKKENIHYLTEPERSGVASKVLALDLASYRYKDGEGLSGEQIGFVIEDTRGAPFLQKGGERVNLYAYISSVVATVQQQQQEIEALRAEVKALEAAAQQ